MNNDDIRGLLLLAQSGDKSAENDVIVHIRDKYMMKRISKYINKNRQVDNDDIKQEFLIGVGLSIQKVSLGIGDPVEYLISNGIWRVRSYMRKHIVQNTLQVCDDCGAKSRLNKIENNKYQCKKCGSIHVGTYELYDHDEVKLENVIQEKDFVDDIIAELTIVEFKKTLNPGTNVYALFELLESGMDRDSCDNYIKEISTLWGSSQQNVVQNLKKLQNKYEDYINKINLSEGVLAY